MRLTVALIVVVGTLAFAQENVPTPTDVKPGSITCEDVPYPAPVSYLSFKIYGQDVRMAYMDVAPAGQPNGHTVVLLHGMNFAGFYWGGPIDVLRKEGFRVVVPDQIGFGRSSKPILPYNFHDMALNTRRVLQQLNVAKAIVVGHSMGGMLAARFATQYPAMTERLVIYNPIGVSDPQIRAAVDERGRRLSARARRDLSEQSARTSCGTSHTIRRRGPRSSRSTCASATRGRSAATGRATRWCRR